MNAFLDFLAQNAGWLNITWWVTIAAMVGLFIISIARPYGKIAKTLPLTIMFRPKENLDLDFQSVGYAMMHTTWLARISHYTIFIDAFFWFVIFNYFSPVLGILILLLMIYQGSRIGERAFIIAFLTTGVIFYAGSLALISTIGASSAWLLSIVVLMLGGIIRLIGHSAEPAPPMMLDDSDQFVKINHKTVNWKLFVTPIYGYVAEFASGLPNRLFAVQVNYIYQMFSRLNFSPKKTLSWDTIHEKATKIFKGGYAEDEDLTKYYDMVNGGKAQ